MTTFRQKIRYALIVVGFGVAFGGVMALSAYTTKEPDRSLVIILFVLGAIPGTLLGIGYLFARRSR